MKGKKLLACLACLTVLFGTFSCNGNDVPPNDSQSESTSPTDTNSSVVTEPTVSPASATADLNGEVKDLTFTVNYAGGTFVRLTEGGTDVPAWAYERVAAKITLKADYLKTLLSGEHTYTFVTDGGETEFTVTVLNDKMTFLDGERVQKYQSSAVEFTVDFGKNAPAKITVCGAEVGAEVWSYESGKLRFDKDWLSSLKDGFYKVHIFDDEGNFEHCGIVKGMNADEVLCIDFDGFSAERNGFGQDLAIETMPDGLDGGSGKITNGKSGTLIKTGEGNLEYSFRADTKYTLSFEMKINSIVEGTSSVSDLFMPVFFKTSSGDNADIGYLCYNSTDGLYFTAEDYCDHYTLTETNGVWRFGCEFTYSAGWRSLEVPVWMQSSFVVDNILLTKGTNAFVQPKNADVSLGLGEARETTADFGDVSILGAELNGTPVPSAHWTADGGEFTLKNEYVSTLLPGSVNKIQVYTSHGKGTLVIRIAKYALGVTGKSFRYSLDGKALDFTLAAAEFDPQTATVSDGRKTLVKGTDYTIDGTTLSLLPAYLETVVFSEDLTVRFAEDAEFKFTLTSDKLLFIDFDEYAAPSSGFGIDFTKSEADGKTGKGARLVNEKTATLLAIGDAYGSAVTFESGKTYRMEFDLKINSSSFSNLVLTGNNCYMPITFGNGRDVAYLRLSVNPQGVILKNETQALGTYSNLPKQGEDGFWHIEFEFIPTDKCSVLTFDAWMASDIVVDNLKLIKIN